MLTSFGDTGITHTFLVDYELAAIQAIRVTFQDAVLKSCAFHFRQAILRRVQQEGLKTQYENKDDVTVYNWVKRLMSLCMLLTFAIGYAWKWLQQPPSTGSAATDAKLCALASYFGRTWITGEFQARMIQLQAGRTPKPRRRCYVDNDAKLWSAKQQYEIRIASVFTYLFPHPQAWAEFRSATETYLDHCGHMLGL